MVSALGLPLRRFRPPFAGLAKVRRAQVVLTRGVKWSWLKAWAMTIAKNRGLKRAIVALAVRLAIIMHLIWVDGTKFRRTKEEAAIA